MRSPDARPWCSFTTISPLESSRRGIAALLVLAACAPRPQWVAASGSQSSVIHFLAGDLTPLDTRPLDPPDGDTVTALAAAPDGQSVFAATAAAGRGAVVRAGRRRGAPLVRQSLGPAVPRFIALTPHATLLLVGTSTSDGPGALLFLTPETLVTVDSLGVCSARPIGAAVHSDGDRAFVACATDEIAEVDLRLRTVLRTVRLRGAGDSRPCAPTTPALAANGTVLYVVCSAAGRLLLLDRVTLAPFDSVEIGEGGGAAVVAGRRHVVIARPGHDEILIADPRLRAVAARLAVTAPLDLAVSADGRHVYVATGGAGRGPRRHAGQLVRIALAAPAVVGSRALPEAVTHVALWPARTPVMRWW